MPAITLGLAEIEERLHGLRRRLNAVTLLHAASLSLSTVFLVGAALVAVGLRGGVSSFRAVAWSGLGLTAAALVAAVISARRRWLDVAATAALADERGHLTDRLSTLVDLRRRPRPSRLAPVLIAQALALGERWRPQRIAPRRVPRSLFLLLLSLLVLTASPLVAPQIPPATPTAPAAKHQALSPDGMQDGAVPASASLAGTGGSGPGAADHDTPPAAGEIALPQTLTDPASQAPPPAEAAPDTQLALLPDRLRNALLSAFHAEQTAHGEHKDPGQQAGKASNGESREPVPANHGDDRAGAKSDGNTGHRSSEAGKPATERDAGAQASQRPADAKAGGQPQPLKSGDQTQSGSAPNAGTGTSPENLLGTAVTAAEAGQGGTTTFKLTITSFLHAVEEKGNQPRRPNDRGGPAAVAVAADDTLPALNAQQLRDDALRRAEIPPEYEDIVRRVYSLRADQ